STRIARWHAQSIRTSRRSRSSPPTCASLRRHFQLDGAAVASSRNNNELLVERHVKVQVDLRRSAEKLVDVRIVERFHAEDVRSGREPRNDERAGARQRKIADHLTARKIKGDHVCAKDSLAVFR